MTIVLMVIGAILCFGAIATGLMSNNYKVLTVCTVITLVGGWILAGTIAFACLRGC